MPIGRAWSNRWGPYAPQFTPAYAPYAALIRAITHQQLQTRVAHLILERFLACFSGEAFPAPGAILALDPGVLRACGLSQAKVVAIRGVAEAALSGQVPSASRRLWWPAIWT